MSRLPSATVVIPTRARAGYLDVALGTVMPQATAAGAEVLVVSDGPDAPTAAISARHGARRLELPPGSGANAARNAGIEAGTGELVVFTDDDIAADPGWLDALLQGAAGRPDIDVFGGPIRPRLEGGPRACGREPAPITALDLGRDDRDTPLVWSANMAVRRTALERTGPFDERIRGRGEEEEWQRRHAAAGGGTARYLAAAAVSHRRDSSDARLTSLSRASLALGRTARRWDVRKGTPPTLAAELRTLAGCIWHASRRRCAYGIVMAAHTAGRIQETLSPTPVAPAPGEDFTSGASGHVAGVRATTTARVRDAAADASNLLRAPKLRRAAACGPPRRNVLVLAIERPDQANLLPQAAAELRRSRHDVQIHTTPIQNRGKFENLNALLERHPPDHADWLLVLDDDVALPRGFLDTFLMLAERFELALAQPAHRHRSHAAWPVTRRHLGTVARETGFVEIGPLTAFHARTFDALLPFPPLRAGWGLDNHWAAVAGAHGWRIGVVDAVPIAHALRPVAAGYSADAAVAEAREFLQGRPYATREQANRTLRTHRRW